VEPHGSGHAGRIKKEATMTLEEQAQVELEKIKHMSKVMDVVFNAVTRPSVPRPKYPALDQLRRLERICGICHEYLTGGELSSTDAMEQIEEIVDAPVAGWKQQMEKDGSAGNV